MTPDFSRICSPPQLHQWANILLTLGQRDNLRPLAEIFTWVASGGLAFNQEPQDFAPLVGALRRMGSGIDLDTLIRGSAAAQETSAENPTAAFVVAWVVLCIWILGAPSRQEYLYEFYRHSELNPGWMSIPAACATTALKVHGLCGSAQLVNEASEVLQTSLRRECRFDDDASDAIENYRRIGQRIAIRYEMAVDNLIDDIRGTCLAEAGRARYIIGAMWWSLGLVPESAFLNVPSRASLRRLVRRSLELLPSDPLIQHIWLELKEDDSIDWRAHEALFALVDHHWAQWSIDDGFWVFELEEAPSRLFARTLIGVLADDLDQERALQYLRTYALIAELFTTTNLIRIPEKAFIWQRLHVLRHVVVERLCLYEGSVGEDDRTRLLKHLTESAGHSRKLAATYPDYPDAFGRTSLAGFELIDRCLSDDTGLERSEQERCLLVMETFERLRSGALDYWLLVNPPLTSSWDDAESQELLQTERDLLEDLRGAYFLALRVGLPFHFQWVEMDFDVLNRLSSDHDFANWFWSADVARTEIDKIEQSLTHVGSRLLLQAPEYAVRRLSPTVDFERLVSMLDQHSVDPSRNVADA